MVAGAQLERRAHDTPLESNMAYQRECMHLRPDTRVDVEMGLHAAARTRAGRPDAYSIHVLFVYISHLVTDPRVCYGRTVAGKSSMDPFSGRQLAVR